MASRLKSEHNYCCWLQSVYRLIFVVSLHPLYCIVRNPMLRAKWFFGDIVDSVGVFVVKLLCLCSLVLTASCVCNFDDLTLCAVLWPVLRVWFFSSCKLSVFSETSETSLTFPVLDWGFARFIGATTPWDPCDASLPTLEVIWTKCILSPPTRPWCGQPSHRGRLKNRTKLCI